MKRTIFAGVTAAQLIPVSQVSRRVHIFEDGSVAPQGLSISFPDDNFTTTLDILGATATQPYIITDRASDGSGRSYILGIPAQIFTSSSGAEVPRPADSYCKVASKTGTATNVVVEEYD
jgi:hypothetical protein